MVSALMARLADQGLPDDLLAPVAIIMALSAALTGLLLFGLGLARAGGAIRFIPYPVIGGFLGASGCLMVSGAVRVITGHGIGISNVGTLLEASVLTQLLPAVAIALVIYLGLRRRAEGPYILPAVLLFGIALAHVVLAITGTSMAAAEADGWLFKAPAAVGLTPTWDLDDLRMFPWNVLPALSGDLFAVMFVTAISTLLNTTGLEFLTKREADLQRELKTVGVANVIAAGLGGYVSTIALNRTTLNYVAGARGRLSGLTVAAMSVLMLIADPGFLAYVPKFVLGGLLLYLAAHLVYEWLINSARRVSLLEYASLLAIAVLILQIGFIAGVLIGVIIGCTTFAVSASRVNAIKFSFDGSEYRSTLDRGPEELAILAANGREIQGMSLQSYIFFGSANRLYEQVKSLFARRPASCCSTFASSSASIPRPCTASRRSSGPPTRLAPGSCWLISRPSSTTSSATANSSSTTCILADDLDRALESCEKEVIGTHLAEGATARTLREWLARALGSDTYAEQLSELCVRQEFGKDAVIAEQGEPARSMHFILEGRVSIIVNMDDGRLIRVRSLGAHTTIGEMGLITRQTRSATIKAEVPSVLYELSADAYERLKRENSALAQALLTYIVRVMAERLSFASKAIGVLRR
ncbi:MAG: SulP family inorganic anion transporter [Methyloceanibacter sp.]